tara:strand:+ start:350 stop:1177 length:828 start_codon:yes stop_codon:yes gene_type:complete
MGAAPKFLDTKNPNIKPKVSQRPDEFIQGLNDQGLRVWWERAVSCSCVNDLVSSQANVACPVCTGTGWEYLPGQQILAIVSNIDRNTEYMIAFGFNILGMAKFTVKPVMRPGFNDRYTLMDPVMTVSERRTRQAGVTRQALYHPIADEIVEKFVDPVTGALLPNTVLNVHYMRLVSPLTGFPDVVLIRGQDFDVIDGRIDWTRGDSKGSAPVAGQGFNVLYNINPRYKVMEHKFSIREANVTLKKAKGQFPMVVNSLAKFDMARTQPGGNPGAGI